LKTLVTISRSELLRVIFRPKTLQKLESLTQVDWIEQDKEYTSADLARDIEDYDACITGWGSPKFTNEVLCKAARLKFIGHTAGTLVPIVDESVFDLGITIVNANTPLAYSTAECTMALMIAGAWNITDYARSLRAGQWRTNSDTVMGLTRQTVGLIGFGEISKEMIRLLKPYNCKILLCSKACSPQKARELGVTLCSLEELLSNSMIISLHNTLTDATRGMLGKAQLDLIKDGALLVNTARAAIINEAALVETLKTGRISAVLDVFEKEPLHPDHPLLSLSNVVCVPHIGGFSSYWKSQLAQTVVDQLGNWQQGLPLEGKVTREVYHRMTNG
jgi:phosphoglycerate dehydrogenase-like enzyme